MGLAPADGKAVAAVKGLGPPAIQNRAVQPTVEHHFLAARTRRLKWPAGVVQPDVDALNQVAADIDVVVFDEDDPAGHLGIVP